jgi:hypothetical protein
MLAIRAKKLRTGADIKPRSIQSVRPMIQPSQTGSMALFGKNRKLFPLDGVGESCWPTPPAPLEASTQRPGPAHQDRAFYLKGQTQKARPGPMVRPGRPLNLLTERQISKLSIKRTAHPSFLMSLRKTLTSQSSSTSARRYDAPHLRRMNFLISTGSSL